MKLNSALILSIIVAVGIVTVGFTLFQISSERTKLNNELEIRTIQIAKEVFQDNENIFKHINQENIEHLIDSISSRYKLIGIAVHSGKDSVISNNASLNLISHSEDDITQSMIADSAFGNFIKVKGRKVYQYIKPIDNGLINKKISNKSVIFYSDAQYIDNLISSIWVRNFMRWFLQVLFVSFITVFIIRWAIFSPINKIVDWVKAVRIGNIELLKKQPVAGFLAPLHKEIIHITEAMNEAKAIAEEEARLRSNRESNWTPERLKVEMENLLQDKKMVVVSNREPYMHVRDGKNIKCLVPASGLITAMEPILKACGGLWIASGTGDADKETVDKDDKLQVPPENPKYTLKRLWQTEKEEEHFYFGFSNEGLWPLCHIAHTRPTFREEDWFYYKKVNEDFANAVLKETADEEEPFILIQDYHFALLPALIKKQKPGARVAIFWHIPWPNPESFGICPWQKEILKGMLGADLIGFHTQYHCNHFLETVNRTLESRVSWENFSVKLEGHSTLVKPFPISIAFTPKDFDNKSPKIKPSELLGAYGLTAKHIGIGVDRVDYTKGLIEKFLAIERFFEKYPAYVGKFSFVQIGAPSRSELKTYSDIMNDIVNESERINLRFKSKNWLPILFLNKHHSQSEIAPFYASADLCMVSSLHDGMNLVAKEFVASRNHDDGTLILSRFAGAAKDLLGAVIINPYDIEQSADAIKLALEMTSEEQHQRMSQMRLEIVNHNIYLWAADLVRTMSSIQL